MKTSILYRFFAVLFMACKIPLSAIGAIFGSINNSFKMLILILEGKSITNAIIHLSEKEMQGISSGLEEIKEARDNLNRLTGKKEDESDE